ncbi:hypothetical protein ACEWY4_001978 [Coilia grayii]|uniref:Ig-like domain-containing protein n=1 Tax=Coilia grayii TaxID=363190 RepID=A0ABD1KUI5_9TELE
MNQVVWLPFLLVAPLCSTEITYATINGAVTLYPGIFINVTSVLWKFKTNKAAEYDDFGLKYYAFKERASLDLKSGSLTIRELTTEDNGEFLVEVNHEQQNKKFFLQVIAEVSSVHITKSDATADHCVLVCKAEPQSEDKLLKYKWIEKNLNIPTLDVQEAEMANSYTCNASNPVSWKTRTVTAKNLCEGQHPPPSPGPIIGGSLAVIALIGIGVTAWYLIKNDKNERSSGADKNKGMLLRTYIL